MGVGGADLFHAAGNTWSDYRDFKSGVDREDAVGGMSIVSGQFSPEIKLPPLDIPAPLLVETNTLTFLFKYLSNTTSLTP